MKPDQLRRQVERIMADADALSWEDGAEAGPVAAEAYVEAKLAELVSFHVEAAERRTSCPVSVELDQQPPVDIEAERAVLGFLMLLQPSEPTRVRRCSGLDYPPDFGISPGRIYSELSALEFFDEFHRWLFYAMADAAKRPNWVAYLVRRKAEVERLGAVPFSQALKRCTDACGTWRNVPYWIARVKAAAKRRELFNQGHRLIQATAGTFEKGG